MSPIETALSLRSTEGALALFDTNKAQRESFAQSVIERIIEGQSEPHKVHLYVKCMEDIIKRITTDPKYKEHLLADIEKHGRSGLSTYNAEFKVKEAGVEYSYDNCEDPIIDRLQIRLEETKAAIKSRSEFLKSLPASGMEVVVDDELIRVYPPAKSSTTTVETKLK